MIKKHLICTLLLLTSFTSIKSQSNDVEAALYNIGSGAVFSTIGAIINKKPNEPLGNVIKKSLWQGALGGGFDFSSKTLLREAQQQDKWEYILIAKLVNSAGTSIKENAAMNRDFWEKWHINIGFNRIEINTKNKFSIQYKLMPVAFAYTTDAFFRYNFEFENSLKTGEFVFSTKNKNAFENGVLGYSTAGHIVYAQNNPEINLTTRNFQTIIHEIAHQYQSNDFSILNTYTQKQIQKWSEKNKTINWVNQHLFIEYYYILLRPLYIIETNTANTYYDNFFEREAGYYSNTLHNY